MASLQKASPERSRRIRVRIAPSPTGFAHVGTAYAALFNYAYARHNKGTFIVRVEDTDVKRNVKGAEEAIFEGLKWLGIDWDEGGEKGGKYGPYRQSEKLEKYQKIAKDLVKKGLAYEEEGAIRFRNPGKDVSWEDLVHGKISFPGGEVTDFVLLKSDGYPTYNFGVVIDDIDMKITHVIRGEEHISNTPRQLALYDALGEKPPLFAHHPTLRNKDHKKLSKRRDPVDLRIFRDKGYLPEALVNFLCLLGWSHPEGKEIFSLKEFVDKFDLSRVRKAGPIFDLEKLDWLNKHYLSELSPDKFHTYVSTASIYNDVPTFDQVSRGTAPIIQPRVGTISQYDNLVGPFFVEPKPDKDLFGRNYKIHIKSAVDVLEKIKDWKTEKIGDELVKEIKKRGYDTGKFFMDLRIATMGQKVSPPFNESVELIGKNETMRRLKRYL